MMCRYWRCNRNVVRAEYDGHYCPTHVDKIAEARVEASQDVTPEEWNAALNDLDRMLGFTAQDAA